MEWFFKIAGNIISDLNGQGIELRLSALEAETLDYAGVQIKTCCFQKIFF